MALTDREISLLQAQTQQPGTPISRASRLSTSSSTYGTVVTWTIAAGQVGDLSEIGFISDLPASTQWRLTINGVVQWVDQIFQLGVTVPLGSNRLPAGAIVLVEGRSPDNVTAIVLDGTIAAVERTV